MANTITYNGTVFAVGDTIAVDYKIKEGEKFRIQQFAGVLIKIKGASESQRMITVRKMSKAGIGVERIIPLSSPFIDTIKLVKPTSNTRAKIYYIRDLSEKKLRRKLYHKVSVKERASRKSSAAETKAQFTPEPAPAEEPAKIQK